MYTITGVSAFFLRLICLGSLFFNYPLLSYFLYDLVVRFFYRRSEPKMAMRYVIGVAINILPFLAALWKPITANIEIIIGFTSALCGWLIIYIFPVITYLRHMRYKIKNPLLAEALVVSEYKVH